MNTTPNPSPRYHVNQKWPDGSLRIGAYVRGIGDLEEVWLIRKDGKWLIRKDGMWPVHRGASNGDEINHELHADFFKSTTFSLPNSFKVFS